MTEQIQGEQTMQLAKELEDDLLRVYGPIIHGRDLVKALGYPSGDAFRQAVSRGVVPVDVFPLENRRGKYALAKDVALWLAESKTRSRR